MAKDPMAELQPQFSSDGATPTPWAEARERLEKAEVYWLATVRPDETPTRHAGGRGLAGWRVYRLMVFPIVLGSGKRLFRDGSNATVLRSVEAKTFKSGVEVLVYQPAGKGGKN